MKAIIIGGGIGGLTTGIALQKQGIKFEIYEAAPELKPVGAGIVMASNAMLVFQRLGIEQKIAQAGLEVQKAFGVDEKFKMISELDVTGKVAPRYGIGSYAIHRGRLQQVLLSVIDGSKVFLHKRLDRVEQTDSKAKVFFQDGTWAEGDIVIGADGIKSATRKSIFGELPLRYSGQTCWRGMAKFTLPDERKGNSYEMWGPKKGFRFGFVPTAKDEVYFYTTYFTSAGGRDAGPNKKKLIELYAPFGDLPRQIVESTPEENIIRSDIHDLAPFPQWWKGRVVLLGDAAHATTPNLGQGGCQAVEDALALALSLKQQANYHDAFKQFQAIRFEKATYVVNTSWQLGKMTNLGNPLSRWLRNSAMRMMPESMAMKTLDKILRLEY